MAQGLLLYKNKDTKIKDTEGKEVGLGKGPEIIIQKST